MTANKRVDADLLRELPLPALSGETDKNSRGRVLVVGGSRRVPGAVALSGLAALRVGAGKIQLAVPASISTGLGLTVLEAGVCPLQESPDGEPMALPAEELIAAAKQADAVLIGPGIMSQSSAHELVVCLLQEVAGPVYVIDALALCGLWDSSELLRMHAGRVVLTPHAGEMAQLAGLDKSSVDADPIGVAREAAARLSSILVLKGATTLIVTPSGLGYCHTGGVVGLATAGSGDVLAGIVAGLASRGAAPLVAATWGVFLHGRAGTHLTQSVGRLGFIARDLIEQLPALLEVTESSVATQ
jgi:hydroxyethylthiazole kinase-like uncharacterized protein yjeF